MTIDSVTADGIEAPVTLAETIARVDLPRPLAPDDSVVLRMRFAAQVPPQTDRFGHTGESYSIAQWYPKVVVYDDLGWHLDPFHYMSEFYGEYATYDVAITLPDPHWVGATGALLRAEGGDNDVPLFASEASRDSVTVSLGVVLADSLAGRWPRGGLVLETDLHSPRRGEPLTVPVSRGERVTIRVPRAAPIHYAYLWDEGKPGEFEEADPEGRPRPLRRLSAAGDTSVVDTLRALASLGGAADTTLPSIKTLHYRAERVHDFAWVASPDYVRSDTTWSGIDVRTLVFREDEEKWRDLKTYTVDALRHFAGLVGPYVWPRFTAAEAYCGGSAMEYPMLVMNEPVTYSEFFHSLDDVNAHEVAHGWFYGMLGSDERAFPWLDEGFTQYIEDDYIDTKYPAGLLRQAHRLPWLGRLSAKEIDEQSYLARAWARDEQPIATSADRCSGWATYGVAAYSKPAGMLHSLRGVLGDSIFTAFLREYYGRNLLRHPRPADVYQAASDASGEDLSDFFHSWVETVDRAGFALRKVHREREGDLYKTSVTVRRTESMVFPITVQARFADGSVQERRVLPRERETPAVFESRAPFTGAVIDPRHEVIEVDRLDNRTGLLPPMRFHFLTGFPSAEAYRVAFGPTLWHGVREGIRLGAWLDGRYLPSQDFPYGIRGFEGGLSLGTRDNSVAYRAGVWRRWAPLGARSRLRALVARDEGLFRMGIHAGNTAMAPARRHPYRSWAFSLEYRDRDEIAPVDPRYWSLGRTLNVAVTLGLETQGPRRQERLELGYRRGAAVFREGGDPSPDANYDWLRFAARQGLNLFPKGDLKVSWRVAAGTAFRRVPRELQFDIAEESRLDELSLFYANDRGPLRGTDHFLVPGGGGLRGYSGRGILGRRMLAGGLAVGHAAYPIHLFAGLGQAGARLHPRIAQTPAELGLGVRVGPVEVAFPFWISHPVSDESPWRFRWRFFFRGITLPRPT